MAANRFYRYVLRTTEPEAARAFYTGLFEATFFGPDVSVAVLPERILALGGRPHWLGNIGTDAIEETASKLVAAGAQQLGPTMRNEHGPTIAVLRDPSGALLALSPGKPTPGRKPVAFHVLHAQDEAKAFALYASLFGWAPTAHVDRGPELGKHQMFAWEPGGETVGSVANTGRARVHPAIHAAIHAQWLFFFPVDDIERAVGEVRARGGLALDVVETARGDRLVPCDDPQGAAFGMFQAAAAR